MGCDIELNSITNAIKARDLLRLNNVKARIEKNSKGSERGCSYSVITNNDCDSALRILSNKVKVIGIS